MIEKEITQEFMDESVDPLVENMENMTVSYGTEASFAGKKKKKKKQVDSNRFNDGDGDSGERNDDIREDEQGFGTDQQSEQPRNPWERTDRDYVYEELLGMVFNNDPRLGGDRRRIVLRPPQVMREGTKRTVLVNFIDDYCKMMHRGPDHVMTFLLDELGTTGSLDGQQRLVVKGRFAPKIFEGLLRRYLSEYVICHACKNTETNLVKENRLMFLRCEVCGSTPAVAAIKPRLGAARHR